MIFLAHNRSKHAQLLSRNSLWIALLTLALAPTLTIGALKAPERAKSVQKRRPTKLSLAGRAAIKDKQATPAFFDNPALERKIGPQLTAALRQAKTRGVPSALRALETFQPGSAQDNRAILFIRTTPGANAGAAEARLTESGAEILRVGQDSFKIKIALPAVECVAALPQITSIRTLLPPRKKAITSQGVAATGATTWHSYGFTGAGTKVAVVDTGFKNLATYQQVNEIPTTAITKNFSASPNMSDIDLHGIACAEIVHDMAPAAQLYLIKIDDVTDLISVKDYCIAQGIHIISCSMGWDLLNFHDGIAYDNPYTYPEGHPVTAVDQATAAGIFCVFPAGNEQEQHSLINWGTSEDYLRWSSTDDELNLLYSYDGGLIIPAGETLYIGMTWNQWPLTANDFDLYLYQNTDSGWEEVAWSERVQDGDENSHPVEEIYYETTSAGEYAVVVARYQNSSTPTFILRYYGTPYPDWYGYDNYTTPMPGSISIPGDAASTFTVGAIAYSIYTEGPIDYYSSLGPNNRAYTGGAAVKKPDICAPVGVRTRSYGATFFGTSAAAPHIAGLAALIKGVYPSFTVAEIRQYIEVHGFDLGAVGKDNTYGSGSALLPAQLPATVTLSNLARQYDGTPKAAVATTIPAGLAVSLTYNGSTFTPALLGTYSVIGTISTAPFYGATTNTLTIVIDPALESAALTITAMTTPAGSVTLQFVGIPGGSYRVLTKPTLTSGTWQPIGIVTLDSNGTASFTDTNPSPGSCFYKLEK